MAWDGFLALGDPVREQVDDGYVRLIDNQRTAALARQFGIPVQCTACGPLPDYVDPQTLPWYDPAVPESQDFLGLLGLRISGLGKKIGTRSMLPVGRAGAVLTRKVVGGREIGVHAYAIALTQCALSYGMQYLAQVLDGDCLPSADGCGGTMPVTVWTCCSTDDLTYRRQLYRVGLITGPEETSRKRPAGLCDGKGFWGADVTWTMGAGRPWLYRDIVMLGSNLPFVEPTYWPCVNWVPDPGTPSTPAPDCTASPADACVQWVPYDPAVCSTSCPGDHSGTCMSDPQCPDPVEPPLPPDGGDPCACLVVLNPVVVMARAAEGVLPKYAKAVPWVQVQADQVADMRRLLIRFYRSDTGASCDYNALDDCDLVGEIGLPYLPAGSTLTLDGRSTSALVTCPDGSLSEPMLFSTAGPAVSWPVLDCATAYCVAVTVDPGSLPDAGVVTANISVGLAAQEEAA